jgi:TRAP-type mannitol/chloroaromatic compound transport system permease large subunit
VGQLFAAALLPGLVLVAVYIAYLLVKAFISPQAAPALAEPGERPSRREIGKAILPPVLLIVAVLGSILAGIATPSEAASVGAVGALLLAAARGGGSPRLVVAGAAALAILAVLAGLSPVRLQRSDAGLGQWLLAIVATGLVLVAILAVLQSLYRAWRSGILLPVMTSTMTVTAMIFATILTASVFSLIFRSLGGDLRVEAFLHEMPGGPQGALLFVMAVIFVLGFFLDFVEISVIVLPIVAPILILMGHDPIWLSMLIAINLQTSFLTPPFGFSLFYLRGAAPKEISTAQIYRGVMPFIGLQIAGMLLVWLVPQVATVLPAAIF